MKIALIKKKKKKKKLQENHHLKISFIHSKDDLSYKNAEMVPNFAARWCSIREHLIQYKANNQGKQYKIQQQNEKYTTRL